MPAHTELYKKCPSCGKRAIMRVPPIEGGDVDVDDTNALSVLSLDDLRAIQGHLMTYSRFFECECGNCFDKRKLTEEQRDMIRNITGWHNTTCTKD